MTHLIRKPLKLLNSTGNEFFYQNSNNCGLEIVLTQDKKMCLLLSLSASPYPKEQVRAIPQLKYLIHFPHFRFLRGHLNCR